MAKSFSFIAIFSLFLTACANNPVSYLPTGTDPIINIEANIADNIKLDANGKKAIITNLTKSPLTVIYKLFWYDKDGVTQLFNGIDESTNWQKIGLQPEQKHTIILVKPTEESVNYRLYLRGDR
ncbi:YcfL family protein [Mannheimia sp. AT1]|uniref:YcfL family protein n=1 Tax=Mannheimia cairinae TaxID=3025936 RepID=A0ABT5MNY8_9PAST|nr:YcfL family protein [Mannheimia cairinae]MDD0823206.1 YcfL family protein [Mannheimia cairinae]MDD0825769.1 YcfL family protein [Mannheimia cairinae]